MIACPVPGRYRVWRRPEPTRRQRRVTIALMESKQPVSVVSRRLGHSKTSIMLDFYAHAMPRDDEEASDAVAALVMPEGF